MTFGAQREDTPVEIRRGEPEASRVKGNFQLTKNVSRLQVPATLASKGLPRKVMVVGYFAESKGLVGWHYRSQLDFKVRRSVPGSD